MSNFNLILTYNAENQMTAITYGSTNNVGLE